MNNILGVPIDKRIAIVGGGPVGLALSLILAKYDVPSVIFEVRDQPTLREESRAITWMPRGLEFMEWIGLKKELDALSVPRDKHEFWANDKKLLTLLFTHLNSPYQYTAQLPQHDTEVLLEKAALQTGLVEIRRNHKVLEVGNNKNQAFLKVEGQNGLSEMLFPWAVGADGAKSMVRKGLGIQTKWRDYGTNSAVADFEMDTDIPVNVSSIILDPERPYGFFNFSPGHWRFIYRLNKGEDRKEMTSEKMATALLLEKKPNVKIKKFLWASAFRLGQAQSEKYREGRWVLVGDAAHAMGPSAGAGMMIGILGAWRLGWRLALAFKEHELTENLLNDYQKEQHEASNEIQKTNAIIFTNMAMSNKFLAFFLSRGLQFASHFSSVAKDITEKEALVKQVLPVQDAVDQPIKGLWIKRKKTGDWITGKRIPYLPSENHKHLVVAHSKKHTIISIGKHDPEKERKIAEQIAAKFPFESQIELNLIKYSKERKEANSIVFAIVRPDQHIACIIESK